MGSPSDDFPSGDGFRQGSGETRRPSDERRSPAGSVLGRPGVFRFEQPANRGDAGRCRRSADLQESFDRGPEPPRDARPDGGRSPDPTPAEWSLGHGNQGSSVDKLGVSPVPFRTPLSPSRGKGNTNEQPRHQTQGISQRSANNGPRGNEEAGTRRLAPDRPG